MLEIKKTVDPYEVQAWIRRHEAGFYSVWGEHALDVAKNDDIPGLGFEHILKEGNKLEKIFTGSGMCLGAVLVFGHSIRQKFGPETYLEIVEAEARSINRFITVAPHDLKPFKEDFLLFHVWFRFLGDNGRKYFVDPSYGQINLSINRIVLDQATKERTYYRYDGRLRVYPLENPVLDEDEIIHYQKVLEALLD